MKILLIVLSPIIALALAILVKYLIYLSGIETVKWEARLTIIRIFPWRRAHIFKSIRFMWQLLFASLDDLDEILSYMIKKDDEIRQAESKDKYNSNE